MAKKKAKQKHGIPGEELLSSPPDSAEERPSWLIKQSYCMVDEAKEHKLSKQNKRKLFSLFWEECKIGRENITDFVEAVVSISAQVRIGLHEKYDSLYEDLEKLVRKSLRESTANIDEFFRLYELQIRLMLKRRVISKIEADDRVRDMRNGFAILAKELQYDLEADLKVGDKKGESQDSLANGTPLNNERPEEKSGTTSTSEPTKKQENLLPPSRQRALDSFIQALCENETLVKAKLADIYNWIMKPENLENDKNPYKGVREKPKQKKTWESYLRQACKRRGTSTDAIREKVEKEWLFAKSKGYDVVYAKDIDYHSSQSPD